MKKIGKYGYWIIVFFIFSPFILALAIEYQFPWRLPAGKHGDWLGFWGSVIGSTISTLLAAGIAYFVTRKENDRVSKKNEDIARKQFVLTERFKTISEIDYLIYGLKAKMEPYVEANGLPAVVENFYRSIEQCDIAKIVSIYSSKPSELNGLDEIKKLERAIKKSASCFQSLGYSADSFAQNEEKIFGIESDISKKQSLINSPRLVKVDSMGVYEDIDSYFNSLYGVICFFHTLNSLTNWNKCIKPISSFPDLKTSNMVDSHSKQAKNDIHSALINDFCQNTFSKEVTIKKSNSIFKEYKQSLEKVEKTIKCYEKKITN